MKKMLIVLTAIFTSLVTTVVCLTASASTAKYLGDIDGNGKIESADARSVLRMAVGLEEPIVLDDAAAWEDGTKLVLHESQTLPYAKTVDYNIFQWDEESGPNEIVGETEVKITNIEITKERYDGVWETNNGAMDTSNVQKYRYYIKVEGACDLLQEQNMRINLHVQYLASNNDAAEDRHYCLTKEEKGANLDNVSIKTDDRGFFSFECYQYNIFEDYDSFHIKGFAIG